MYKELYSRQFEIIKSDFDKGQLAPGYILEGPTMLGHFEFAKEVVKELDIANTGNILSRSNVVIIDKLYRKGINDFEEVSKHTNIDQSHRKDKKSNEITVEDINKAIERFVLRDMNHKNFVLIADFERANIYATDKLLKILEEYKDIHFFFSVSDINKVKPTIVSRCKIIRFEKKPKDEIIQLVQDESISLLAQGLPLLAIKIKEDKDLYIQLKTLFDALVLFKADKNYINFHKIVSKIDIEDSFVSLYISYILEVWKGDPAFFDFAAKAAKMIKYFNSNKIEKKAVLDFLHFNLLYLVNR